MNETEFPTTLVWWTFRRRLSQLLKNNVTFLNNCVNTYTYIHIHMCVCVCVVCSCSVAQSYLTLCNTMDCSPPGSSVHEISQTRILEFLAISSSRGSFRPRDRTCISCIGRQILHCWAIRETLYMCIVSVSCSGMPYSLRIDPKDYNLPGSSVHGILQTRILEWVAIPFSRWSSWPRDQMQVSCMSSRFFTVWVIRENLYMCIYVHKYTCIFTCTFIN